MKSQSLIFYFIYILPFFLIVNKGLATAITLIILIYMGFRISYNRFEFLNYLKKNRVYIYPILIFNTYLIFNTFFVSENYMQSIGRLLVFNIFTIFIIFFKFFLNIYSQELNLKKLSLIFLLIIFLLIFDTYFQFFFRTDLLGYEIITFRLTGPFGDEQIVGAFLYKFMFFSIFFILKNKYLEKFLLLFLALFLSIIILSGERVAAIYGIFFIFIFILFNFKVINSPKQLVLLSILISIVFFQSFKVIYKSQILNYMSYDEVNNPINYNAPNRIDEITFTIINRYTRNLYADLNFNNSSYFKLFKSGIGVWEANKLFGVGLKNYRLKCIDLQFQKKYECSSHPHNLFIELISELGLVGLIIFCYGIFIYLYKFINNRKIPIYLLFSLSPSLLPLVNTSFFNSFSILVLLYQIMLLMIISNYK